MEKSEKIGLYIHIPFCVSKCPYCDFYSLPRPMQEDFDAYTQAVCRSLDEWSEATKGVKADTLYFGGGTPSLLGGERLARLTEHARRRFGLAEGSEITMEANPADDLQDTLKAFAAAGGNRLSMGMQSAHEWEQERLGRRHRMGDVLRTVEDARKAGIERVSVDLMLGISGQTVQSAVSSVETAIDLGVEHISAYLLKIEPNTAYGIHPPALPDEEQTADIYLAATQTLEEAGYPLYEISNAARPGAESRHNLKYWLSQPYLGIGPAAGSFYEGKRFSYPRDVEYFQKGGQPTEETDDTIPAGSEEEFALLRLRLARGLEEEAFARRFGTPIPQRWKRQAQALPRQLCVVDETGIRLTREGFLVSNTLIQRILA